MLSLWWFLDYKRIYVVFSALILFFFSILELMKPKKSFFFSLGWIYEKNDRFEVLLYVINTNINLPANMTIKVIMLNEK